MTSRATEGDGLIFHRPFVILKMLVKNVSFRFASYE